MTYLELVNAVLARLREDQVTTVSGADDVVVDLVKSYVNDAKRTVEDSHNWNALSAEWDLAVSAGTDSYVLADSNKSAVLQYVLDDKGNELRQTTRFDLRKRALGSAAGNTPRYYVLDGADASGNIKVRMWPAPIQSATYQVHGFQHTAPLANDTDRLLVPAQPVIYFAEAMAARERGDVGGTPAAELLSMAGLYLRDAIARDAVNSEPENIWTIV